DIGLLQSLGAGSGYYQIHPALPWYFTSLFTAGYGPPEAPAAGRATPAYTHAIGAPGDHYHRPAGAGPPAPGGPVLWAAAAHPRQALDLARGAGWWLAELGCLQGLRVLHERTGRDGEWVRLVAAITSDFTDPATGGPLPGREDQWSIVTEYRVRLAENA